MTFGGYKHRADFSISRARSDFRAKLAGRLCRTRALFPRRDWHLITKLLTLFRRANSNPACFLSRLSVPPFAGKHTTYIYIYIRSISIRDLLQRKFSAKWAFAWMFLLATFLFTSQVFRREKFTLTIYIFFWWYVIRVYLSTLECYLWFKATFNAVSLVL